jgi:3D (Asp-Asp-Asp) domain-containing protein
MKNKILFAIASVVLAIVVWLTASIFDGKEQKQQEELLTEWEEIATLSDTSWEYEELEVLIETQKESSEIVLESEPEWVSLGRFRLTAFCNCSKCCGKWSGGATASGVMPVEGRTIAVDKSVIPLGTEVMIGENIYIVEDTGVKGKCIDIYFDSHQNALNFGTKYREVFIKR